MSLCKLEKIFSDENGFYWIPEGSQIVGTGKATKDSGKTWEDVIHVLKEIEVVFE